MKKFLTRVLATLITTVTLALASAGCFVEEPNPPTQMFEGIGQFATLQNFTLVGGPNQTDLDYGEYYFTENGFRVNTPNRLEATQRDAYYYYDGTTKYTAYRQDATGNWYTQTISKEQYIDVRDGVLELFLAFVNATTVDEFIQTQSGITLDYEYSTIIEGWKHHYYDVQFTVAEEKITNGTWKYYLSNSNNDLERTAVYYFTLTAGNATLTLPQVQA